MHLLIDWGMWAEECEVPPKPNPYRALPDSLSDLAKSQSRPLLGLFQVFAGSLLNPYWISPNLIETPIETL